MKYIKCTFTFAVWNFSYTAPPVSPAPHRSPPVSKVDPRRALVPHLVTLHRASRLPSPHRSHPSLKRVPAVLWPLTWSPSWSAPVGWSSLRSTAGGGASTRRGGSPYRHWYVVTSPCSEDDRRQVSHGITRYHKVSHGITIHTVSHGITRYRGPYGAD